MKVAAFLRALDSSIGALQMTTSLLEALAQRGHHVTAYLDHAPKAPSFHGVRLRRRSDWHASERPSVVISHPDHGTIAPLAAQMSGARYAAVVHNVGSKTAFGLSTNAPDLTLWNSESTRARLGGKGGVIWRSPLDVKAHAATRRGQAVTAVNLSADKGAHVFYALAERLADEAPFLGVKGGHGLQIEPVPGQRVALYDPLPQTCLPGFVWGRTRVFVAPSVEESWGRAATEALCSGIPVVAHPTPGLVESLGPAGIFADRDDLNAWHDEVDRLLHDDAHHARQARASLDRALFLEEQSRRDLACAVERLERLGRHRP